MKKFKLWLIDGSFDNNFEPRNRYCGIVVAKNLKDAKQIIANIDSEEGSGFTTADYIFQPAGEAGEKSGYYPVNA